MAALRRHVLMQKPQSASQSVTAAESITPIRTVSSDFNLISISRRSCFVVSLSSMISSSGILALFQRVD